MLNSVNYIIDISLIVLGIAIFVFFSYAGIVSLYEKEKRASRIFFTVGILSSVFYITTGLVSFPYQYIVSLILLSLFIVFGLIYIIPVRSATVTSDSKPIGQIDERNTMFSRNELKKETDNYINYYSNNPEKELIDNGIRDNPGLLNHKSSAFNRLMFTSSHASFFTIGALKNKVDGEVSSDKFIADEIKMSEYIKNWTLKLGAYDVGITELKDYHKYSTRGRGVSYNKKVTLNHKYAIAFTVEMDIDAVRSGPLAPIVMESAQQYLESGAIAVQLAEFIRSLGYPARAHIDRNYEVVCTLVAKDAGLGEIGRMGLLMTPNLGPRARIAVVTTDIPLHIDKLGFEPSVIDFCIKCKKCAINCPSNSISFVDRTEINGVVRWQINQESCFDFWTKTGTDCGRCMSVCPYSHPDNLLHNIIRNGIKNSNIFSSIALQLDDVIYGKNPAVKPTLRWMNVSPTKN